jgi:hypothetical protein
VLIVPNHHVIVPRAQDYVIMTANVITSPLAARQHDQYDVSVSNATRINLPFVPVCAAWVEIYLDGLRILNPRYPTRQTMGIPNEVYTIQSNTVIFNTAITGNVRVIADRISQPLPEMTSNTKIRGHVISFDNHQSYDRYRQRFNSARWASGKANVNVNTVNVINTTLTQRVGDALWTEPVVLRQPEHGYARITSDRRSILFVADQYYSGLDHFTYTLMTQHGQCSPPACITVNIAGPALGLSLTANRSTVTEGNAVAFTLTTTGGSTVPNGTEFPYIIELEVANSQDFVPTLTNLTGVFAMTDNTSKITFVTAVDNVTESTAEYIRVKLVQYPAITARVQIIDTSQTPGGGGGGGGGASGPPSYYLTVNPDSVPEGGTVTVTISGNNIDFGASGRRFKVVAVGSNVTGSDFTTNSLTFGPFTTSTPGLIFPITVKADGTFENMEFVTLRMTTWLVGLSESTAVVATAGFSIVNS